MNTQSTPFSLVYDKFLSKITDDMYLELTELDTYQMLEELLMSAIFKFEFPRVDLTNYQLTFTEVDSYSGVENDYELLPAYIYSGGCFEAFLTDEEMNILATYMVVEWLGIQ